MTTKRDDSTEIVIREAARADIPEILKIFNERIQNSAGNFYYDPVNLEERQEWWLGLQRDGFPLIVAVHKDQLVGYANLSSFRSKPAYKMYVNMILVQCYLLTHAEKGLQR